MFAGVWIVGDDFSGATVFVIFTLGVFAGVWIVIDIFAGVTVWKIRVFRISAVCFLGGAKANDSVFIAIHYNFCAVGGDSFFVNDRSGIDYTVVGIVISIVQKVKFRVRTVCTPCITMALVAAGVVIAIFDGAIRPLINLPGFSA